MQKLQFLEGWMLFLSKKTTLFWDFLENVRQRAKRADPERATPAKRASLKVKKVSNFWVLYFDETFICYRGVLS